MAKNAVQEWDVIAGNNLDAGGISCAEGQQRASANNWMREAMSQIKKAVANQGSDIASAGTTDIGAATGQYVRVTGTSTITSFGTVNAGTMRWIEFTGALTLTHNATSLKLPGSANISTANGDVGQFVSLGSGNWKCLGFFPVSGGVLGSSLSIASTAAGTMLTLTSTDAGATDGPVIDLYRNSASPLASDEIGQIEFNGKDSAGNKQGYGFVDCLILDPTNGSEDGTVRLVAYVAGAATEILRAGPGVTVGGATDKGAGTVNAPGLYVNGHGTIAQVVSDTEAVYTTCGTIMPNDDTIPQNTEGDEVLSVAITPVNASSILRIRANLHVGGATGATICAGLFVDSTASALNAGGTNINTSAAVTVLTLAHEVSAGSTSSRTYKVRVGTPAATDCFLNGDLSARQFGGRMISSLVVEEVLPQ